jgi:hypothetical protein
MDGSKFELKIDDQRMSVSFLPDGNGELIAMLECHVQNDIGYMFSQQFTKSAHELLVMMTEAATVVRNLVHGPRSVLPSVWDLIARVTDERVTITSGSAKLVISFSKAYGVKGENGPMNKFPFGLWDVTLEDLQAAFGYTFDLA